jgi:hypothetical protein
MTLFKECCVHITGIYELLGFIGCQRVYQKCYKLVIVYLSVSWYWVHYIYQSFDWRGISSSVDDEIHYLKSILTDAIEYLQHYT